MSLEESISNTHPVEPDTLRRAMRLLASGVGIVTCTHDGLSSGITVSSLTPVSLDPPVIMVAINRESSISPLLGAETPFAVHILSAEQAELSERFADSLPWHAKVGDASISTGLTGAPLLSDTPVILECLPYRDLEIGTHQVHFGLVVAVRSQQHHPEPLLYFDRNYRTLDPGGS